MICPTCGHDNLPGNEECSNCLQDLTPLDRPAPQTRVERSLMEDPVSAAALGGMPGSDILERSLPVG